MNEYFGKILVAFAILLFSGLVITLLMNLEKKFFGTSNLYKAIGKPTTEMENPKTFKIIVLLTLIFLVLIPILYKMSCDGECKEKVQLWFRGQ